MHNHRTIEAKHNEIENQMDIIQYTISFSLPFLSSNFSHSVSLLLSPLPVKYIFSPIFLTCNLKSHFPFLPLVPLLFPLTCLPIIISSLT